MEHVVAMLVGLFSGVISYLGFCYIRPRGLAILSFSPAVLLIIAMLVRNFSQLLHSEQIFETILHFKALLILSYIVGAVVTVGYFRIRFIGDLNAGLKKLKSDRRLHTIDLLRLGFDGCEQKFDQIEAAYKAGRLRQPKSAIATITDAAAALAFYGYDLTVLEKMKELREGVLLSDFSQRILQSPLVPDDSGEVTDESLEAYITVVLRSFSRMFFKDGAVRFVIRRYEPVSEMMEVMFPSNSQNKPGAISLAGQNMISKAQKAGKPIAYSRNKLDHFKTKADGMGSGLYIDYVSHCIISDNGKPKYSLCCDVKDEDAQAIMLALLDLDIFSSIGVAIADRISILAAHKAFRSSVKNREN